MRRETPWILYLICCPFKGSRKNNIVPLHKKGIGIKIVIRADLCLTKDITYIYIHINPVKSACKMMEFTKNDRCQRDIINKLEY